MPIQYQKGVISMFKAIVYLNTNRANEMLDFYQEHFDAKILSKVMGDDAMFADSAEDMQMPAGMAKDFVMNAEFEILGQSLMVSDTWGKREIDNTGANVCFTFDGNHPEEVARAKEFYHKAEAAGCEITMPLGETEWTSLFAMFDDPFGISWMLSAY